MRKTPSSPIAMLASALALGCASLAMFSPAPAQAKKYAPIVSDAGLCLDAHGPTAHKNGGRVQVWACTGGDNQRWRWGRIKKEIKLPNGKCLDARRSQAKSNGGEVIVWKCHGDKNQKWRFKQGRLVNGMGLCLDVHGPSAKRNGGRVRVWACNNGSNQRWGRDRKGGLLQMFEPHQRDCGAENQRVCRKNEQLRGCDPGFHRTKLVGGICTRDNKLIPDALENGDLKVKAREIADAMLPHQRVLREIGQCVARSGRDAFHQAVKRKDMKAASRIVFSCVSPEQLRILATPPAVTAAGALGFKSISVGVGASSMFGAGLGGEAGVVFAIDASAKPRFYTAGGMKFGFGAGVSGDVIVGVSTDRVAPGKSDGIGVGAGGKAIGGAGVSVFFSNIQGGRRPFNGFSVSGGVGASFEIGTINPTWSRIY